MATLTPRAPALLRPALAVTDRVRTSARLASLVAVLLIPGVVSSYAYSSAIGTQTSFASQEQQGVAVLAPALADLAAVVHGDPVSLATLSSAVTHHPGLKLSSELSAVTSALSAPDAGTAAGRAASAGALVSLITADSNTWLGYLAGERSLIWAILRGKIRVRGSLRLLSAFGRCFPR